MKRTALILAAVAIAAGTAAGCGGGGDDTSADEQAIRDLVAQVNRASADGDAKAACNAIAPSSIKEKFQTEARCIRETGAILKEAGAQPAVEVDSIQVSGDKATVTFKGGNFEQEFIREDGKWYVPIASEPDVSTGSGSEGAGS